MGKKETIHMGVWTTTELDSMAMDLVGNRQVKLEDLRKQMEAKTGLGLTALDLAIRRVCSSVETEGHKRVLQLNKVSLAKFKELQEKSSKS